MSTSWKLTSVSPVPIERITEPSDPAEDNALIESLRRNPGVVLATTSGAQALGSDDALAFANARAGSAEVPRDPGGYFRRLAFEVDGVKSLPVAVAEQADRVKAEPFDETTWIDYRGPPGAIERVSFSEVADEKKKVPDGFFRDKIVLVGPTSKSLQDLHPTSTSGEQEMSGVEVLANGVFTVRAERRLQSAPGWLSPFLILMLGFASPAASLRASPLRALALAVVLAFLFLVIAQLAFNAGLVIPVVYPLIALGVSGIATLGVHYVTEAFERERVRDLFSRFVPDDVVTELLAQTEDGELRLGGKRVECTVLFSDLRGFTSFSEAAGPEQVIEVLNHYLGEMSEAILDAGGTLTAYLGDGIMAVFGAPLAQDDHADRALQAAREMLRRVEDFNRWMVGQGFGDGFKMGIGLNSGPVMVGNVGSQRRVEYTAIGDAVNTAARLEGMTKGTPHQVYVAESTRSRLSKTQYDLELVGSSRCAAARAECARGRWWRDRPPGSPTRFSCNAGRAENRGRPRSVHRIG
ncbi:MAG: CHASE2 domain-containing protein [Thermoleophilaceae bacterium]|nr:CHASE2 domain-containing protein [Thermoleophilaceae bacterium]